VLNRTNSEPPDPSLWPLAWLSTFALDAPLVCVGWFWLLASGWKVAPPIPEGLILGLSVWLAYMADRWFDGWRLQQDVTCSSRHLFVRANRVVIGYVWPLVLVVTVAFAIGHLTTANLRDGMILLAVVLAYFGAIHLGPRWLRRSAPKEFATALILVSGILLFLPFERVSLPILAAIASLFFANCLLISRWESETGLTRGPGSTPDRIPADTGWIRVFLVGTAGGTMIAAAGWSENSHRPIWLAVGLSALLLLLLDLTSNRWSPPNRRAMADITLMTPWLILLARI